MALNISAAIIRRHRVISVIMEVRRRIGGLKSGRGKTILLSRENLSCSRSCQLSLEMTGGGRFWGWGGMRVEREELGEGVAAKAGRGRRRGACSGSGGGWSPNMALAPGGCCGGPGAGGGARTAGGRGAGMGRRLAAAAGSSRRRRGG